MEKSFSPVFHKITAMLIKMIILVSGLLFSTHAFSQTISYEVFLVQQSQRLENTINVRLNGATEYETVEVFGKVLNNTQGIVEARRHGSRIVPDNPRACFAVWQVRIQELDPVRIQANILRMIQDIRNAGGNVVIKGVGHRYSKAEVDLLNGIRPGNMVSGEIQFIVF
jgi:hypothetical protein